MKLKRVLTAILTCLFISGVYVTVKADAPFREHRFSGFRTLPICSEGDIVFIGNSITNMPGWYELVGSKYNVHGRGNSGGYAEEVLANLQSMIAGKPSKVFLMIGTNNLGDNGNKYNTPETLAPVIQEILTSIRTQVPEAEVYYQSILPTLVGSRTKAKTEGANKAMQEWITAQNDSKLHYVDLYSKFVRESDGSLNNTSGTQSATSWSYDGLHLTQKGYKLWLDEIAPFLGEGYECVLPAEADNLWGGLASSNGMRVTYFGATPTTNDDILIFGDENINSGEWHELLGSADFKNRGNGWGYSTAVLSAMAGNSFFKDALKGNADKGVTRQDPKAVVISAGAYEIQSGTAASVFNTYKKAVSTLRTILPETPLFLCTLPPASNSGFENKIQDFNGRLKETYGGGDDNITVIDIHSALMTGGERNHDCFMGKSTSATDSYYLSGRGYVKFAQKLAEAINDYFGTDFKPVTDEEMENNLRLYEALTGIYNGKPNAGNSGEPISGDQIELFYSLIPELRAKLTRGEEATFLKALEEAYNFARENAEPAPVLNFVTQKIVINPGLDNGRFYRGAGTTLSEVEPWPYTGTFLGITGNCFLVGHWESLGGEVSVSSSSNDNPGVGYNNNLFYFEHDGFAACGNPNATVENPYIYVFKSGEDYTINRIYFRSAAMQDADQIWIYDGEQYVAKAGGEEVVIDLGNLDSQEVWLGLVGQNKGASMADLTIELTGKLYEDENTVIINGAAGTSYTVNNSSGDPVNETETIAGLWVSHNTDAGVTLRGRNKNGGYNNIFDADSDWLSLNNGNSNIDIVYELECNEGYVITGVYAELQTVGSEESIPWLIEGETYMPSAEGTVLAIEGVSVGKFSMDPGAETANPIVPTCFRNFYVTVEKSSGVENIIVSDKGEDAPVVFYDLQGRRVTNPGNGIFIRRQGEKSSKVVIR